MPTTRHQEFGVTPEVLQSLHDPKSIEALRELGGLSSLAEKLNCNLETGLQSTNEDDLVARAEHFGANALPVAKAKSFFYLAWQAMHDKVLILLSVAAIVSLALGLYETFGREAHVDALGNEEPKVAWVEGVAIIVAILIVVIVGSANDYQKERQFARLNAQKEDRQIKVIRDGAEEYLGIYDLLVGDILFLETGDIIPADGVLVSGRVECDESSATGESDAVLKIPADKALEAWTIAEKEADLTVKTNGHTSEPDPFLLSGTAIVSGQGRAITTAVGTNSFHGRTMMSLRRETPPTPLQCKLNDIADGIAKYGSLIALLLFIVLFIRYLCLLPEPHRLYYLSVPEKVSRFFDILIVAITLIVVAVPEGLPLAVTLALAFATTRMAKDGNLVRVLKSCETMGSATCVCSDKTGTLTENRMRVVAGVIADGVEFVEPEIFRGSGIENVSSASSQIDDQYRRLLLSSIALNSTAFENMDYTGEQPQPQEGSIVQKEKDSFAHFLKMFKSGSKPAKRQFGEDGSRDLFLGMKTETALLLFAREYLGMSEKGDLNRLRKLDTSDQRLNIGIKRIVQFVPFESDRKWGGCVVELDTPKPTFRLLAKGAAEIVLGRAHGYLPRTGEPRALDESTRNTLRGKIDSYASESLRTLCLAYRDFYCDEWPPRDIRTQGSETEADPGLLLGKDSSRQVPTDTEIPITSFNEHSVPKITSTFYPNEVVPTSDSDSEPLVILGIFGIQDPLRANVSESIQKCTRAGVRVRMVTGDNILTAKSIASACGILTPSGQCMEGPVFRTLTLEERKAVMPKLDVLARSSPEDKRILVETLKELGEIVAVTGDGTNDAPALKLADVGFAMGIAGTEVAREASDIILLSDDFTAIVNALKWGRTVTASVKKFLQFQLTVNVTAVVLTFVSAVSSPDGESVLTAVQLLWVNLIMDTFAALALATDKPSESVLERRPAKRSDPLITVSMWKMILGQSTLQLVITFVLYFAGTKIWFGSGPHTAYETGQIHTMTFNAFVWLQFWKLWVTRKLDEADGISKVRDRITMENLNFFSRLFRNWYFLGIAAIIAGCQILIVFVGGAAFKITKQTGPMWATAIVAGMMSVPWGVLIRICPDEWAVKAFPTKTFRICLSILTFSWIGKLWRSFRGKKNSDQDHPSESEIKDDLERQHRAEIYEGIPAFGQVREELVTLRKVRGGRISQLTLTWKVSPLQAYRNWRSRSGSRAESRAESGADTLLAPSGHSKATSSEASSLSNASTLSALAIIPGAVGGAIAGWKIPKARPSVKLEESDSEPRQKSEGESESED